MIVDEAVNGIIQSSIVAVLLTAALIIVSRHLLKENRELKAKHEKDLLAMASQNLSEIKAKNSIIERLTEKVDHLNIDLKDSYKDSMNFVHELSNALKGVNNK